MAPLPTLPAELAHAAENHHHERLDDEVVAHVVLGGVEVRENTAGDAGQAGGEGERQGIDRAGVNTQSRCHGPILHHGPDLQAKRGLVEPEIHAQQTHGRDADDEQAIAGNDQRAQSRSRRSGLDGRFWDC